MRNVTSGFYGLFVASLYIFIPLLTIFGIGRAFMRHGAVDGFIAASVWPWAWYRGVEVLWEEPEWKQAYDARTEQIALVMLHTLNDDPEWQMAEPEVVSALREWLEDVPEDERTKLKDLANELGLAFAELVEEVFSAKLNNESVPDPASVPSIKARLKRFSMVPGYATAWRDIVDEIDAVSSSLDGFANEEGIVSLHVEDSDPRIDSREAARAVKFIKRRLSGGFANAIEKIFAR